MSYTNKKYDINISQENSPEKFKSACMIIEKVFPSFQKESLLVDVDGSMIQVYRKDGKEIIIYDDYDVGAVFAESDVNLKGLFDELQYADLEGNQQLLMQA